MNGFAATLLTVSLFFFITADAMAQRQPVDAGSPVTLSTTDTPIANTVIDGVYSVIAQQSDGTYVRHGADGSFQSYPGVQFISDVNGRFASFGEKRVNQNGPIRLDLVTGDLYEPPPALDPAFQTEIRPSVADGTDVTGGLIFQLSGSGAGYHCPGRLNSVAIPETFDRNLRAISGGAAIDCPLGVAVSIAFSSDFSTYSYFISPDLSDTSAEYSPLGFKIQTESIVFPVRPTYFAKIRETEFDSNFSVIMQGPNNGDLCYLYNGSDASLISMQPGDRCIDLTPHGIVYSDAAGHVSFMNTSFERITLTSNGAPYNNAVAAIAQEDTLIVVSSGGVIVYYHKLEEPQSPACIDTDGDGWGWDGSQTCVVEPTVQPVAGICIDSDEDGYGWNGVASCIPEPPCIDTDGDGWGWTGTESCLVETTNEPVDESIFATLPCIDSDNDGWGWKEPPGRPDLGRSCAIN